MPVGKTRSKPGRAAAKVSRPQLAGVQHRARLYKRIDQARRRGGLTWIAAPAGFGKTTLASGYLEDRGVPHLWYQFDARDADPASFFYFLKQAACAAEPAAEGLPLLTPEYGFGLPAYVANFFEGLAQALDDGTILVFDNHHDLPDTSPLHDLLPVALRSLPRSIHVVFASRSQPPPRFAPVIVAMQATVIGADDLALTREETGRLAAGMRVKGFDHDLLDALHDRMGGWAAGTVLALRQHASSGGRDDAADASSPEALFAYLASEVLERERVADQQVLLACSLLAQVTGREAIALTGLPEADQVLARYARQHLFVQRLAGADSAYRFHALFGDFLRAQVAGRLTREEIADLRRRAGRIASAAGRIDDAVELLIEAEDWGELIANLLAAARVLVETGRAQTLDAWIARIPESRREAEPWLLYWQGQCRLPVSPAAARQLQARALAAFRARGDAIGARLAWCAAVGTVLHEAGGFADLDELIADMAWPQSSVELPRQVVEHVIAHTFGGIVLRDPGHRDFASWRAEAYRVMESGADLFDRMYVATHMVICGSQTGNGEMSRQALRWLDAFAQLAAGVPLIQQLVWASKALHLWLVDADNRACMALVDEALAGAERTGVHVWDHHLLGHGMAAALSDGDTASAERYFSGLTEKLAHARPLDIAYYHMLAMWRALLRNDAAAARTSLDAARHQWLSLGVAIAEGVYQQCGAIVANAGGDRELAREHLDALHAAASRYSNSLFAFMAAATEAAFAVQDSDRERAIHWVSQAFRIGREAGIYNFHLWRSDAMARLCAIALERGIETEYVRDLIRRRRLQAPEGTDVLRWPWRIRIHTLGRFEVLVDDQPLAFAGKAQRRPLDLLAAIVALGGRGVAVSGLVEALWPDAEGDAGHQSFNMALHRLRRLLGDDTAIEYADGRVGLDPRNAWVDVWALERACASRDDGSGDDVARRAREMLSLYAGEFLPTHSGVYWAVAMRERARARFLRCVVDASKGLLAADPDAAVALVERGLEADPLAEQLYRRLIEAHAAAGRKAEAASAFRRCERMLAAQLGIAPDRKTQALFRKACVERRER